jgi:myo-inositol-1(or 4)-monophosphatase
LCYVAAGRLDAYFEAALKPWDEAAGLLVATEAGCRERSLADLVTNQATRVVAREALFEPLCALLVDSASSKGAQANN